MMLDWMMVEGYWKLKEETHAQQRRVRHLNLNRRQRTRRS